jgi:hypothetical protein
VAGTRYIMDLSVSLSQSKLVCERDGDDDDDSLGFGGFHRHGLQCRFPVQESRVVWGCDGARRQDKAK